MNFFEIKEKWFEKDYIYYSPEKNEYFLAMCNIGNFVSEYDGTRWFFISEL